VIEASPIWELVEVKLITKKRTTRNNLEHGFALLSPNQECQSTAASEAQMPTTQNHPKTSFFLYEPTDSWGKWKLQPLRQLSKINRPIYNPTIIPRISDQWSPSIGPV